MNEDKEIKGKNSLLVYTNMISKTSNYQNVNTNEVKNIILSKIDKKIINHKIDTEITLDGDSIEIIKLDVDVYFEMNLNFIMPIIETIITTEIKDTTRFMIQQWDLNQKDYEIIKSRFKNYNIKRNNNTILFTKKSLL